MENEKNKEYIIYYVYYNIINNTYFIDSGESPDHKIGKNFVNIGNIELTDQEVSEIRTSSNDRVYIKKTDKKAQQIIHDKVGEFIDFDKVQKAIAQLCYNFKTNENYKYKIKKEEKEIQIKEEERNKDGKITTKGEKIKIYSIEYKKFEELCDNLSKIINNPLSENKELNTNFLINYTVGLENIIINEINKIGEDKEKTYSLLSYFSEKLLNIYDEIKETKNDDKVIYINCLFSIYDKILKSRYDGKSNDFKSDINDYAKFFKEIINKIIQKEEEENKYKYRHFYIYKNEEGKYYVVEYENGEKEFLKKSTLSGYEYIKEVFLGESDISKFEEADGIGIFESVSNFVSSMSTNRFKAKEVKPISNNEVDYDYAPYSEVYARPVVDEAIEKEIGKIKEEEEERLRKEEEERKKKEEEKELVQEIILPSPKPQISINKNDGIIDKIIKYLPPEDKIKTEDTGSEKLLKGIKEDICSLQINEMVDEEAKKYSEETKKCSGETRKSKEEIAEEIKKNKENEIKEGCLEKETEYTIEAFRRKYTGQKEYKYEKEYIEGGKVKIKIKNYFGDEKDLEMITSEPLQTLENFAKDIIDGKLKQNNSDIIEEQDGKYIYKNIYENIYKKNRSIILKH